METSYLKNFHDLAFSEKNNFLLFIYRLGENRLKKIFRFPGEELSQWWFSIIADKSSFKSDTYEKLISFLLAAKSGSAPGPTPVRMGLKPRLKELFIYQFLKAHYEFVMFLIRVIYIKLSFRDFKSRLKKLSGHDYSVVSYFPSINKEAAARGVFENQYLDSFHKVLDERCKDRYSHILLQVYYDRYGLKEALDLAKVFSQKQSIFFLEEFFKPSHLLIFIFYYFYFSSAFMFNLPWIRKNLIYEHEGKRYNIWHLYKCDFYRSFCGDNLVSSLWFTLLFRELTSHLKKSSKVVSICEMQPWEKALYFFGKKNGLITVGSQHTIVPELLLQYFNAPHEIEGRNFLRYCPTPDYLATVGKTTADLFKRYGWQGRRVFIWGAQRFESIKEISESAKSEHSKENCLICTFSIGVREAKKMLLLLEAAFKDGSNYKILLRPHPSLKLAKLIRQMELKLDPVVFEHIDSPLTEAVYRAKGVITMESSSCLYALARNMPVVIPRFFGMIDCNPLSYISDIPVYAYSAEELRSICDNIVVSSVSDEYRCKCREFLKDYLYFPESKHELFEKIAVLK